MEIWRDIKGFEGKYQVSDAGRVKSFCFDKPKILKPHITNRGYMRLELSGRKKHSIHKLVLEAFVGPAGRGEQCNHDNGDKTDNRLENLEWVSASRNIQHAMDTGLSNIRGEDNYQATLQELDVIDILCRITNGEKQRTLAQEYNVTESLISRIKKGVAWKHIDREVIQ